MLLLLLALLGLLALVWHFGDTAWSLTQLVAAFLRPYFQPGVEQSLSSKYGTWAVVTGSTDGIGKCYAKELARQGLSVVLISRSRDKLLKVAREIEEETSAKTKIIQADFSLGKPIYDDIEEQLKELDIGILVNNVGKQYAYPMYLSEVPDQELWDIININVGAVTMMSRMVLPWMKQRRRGAVVNIGSSAELQPLPLLTVYAATKVYVKNFSEAIRYEYGKFGITVQHLSPFFVKTKMNAFSDTLMAGSLIVPDAEAYARSTVGALGKTNHTTGYWSHGIQRTFTIMAPEWVRLHIGGMMNKAFRKEYFDREKSKQQ